MNIKDKALRESAPKAAVGSVVDAYYSGGLFT